MATSGFGPVEKTNSHKIVNHSLKLRPLVLMVSWTELPLTDNVSRERGEKKKGLPYFGILQSCCGAHLS